MTEYQITYKDTQRASGDENNQIRGVSITDLGSYGLKHDPVTTAAQLGFGSPAVILNANNSGSTYEELIAFFTGANGRKIRISGSDDDGDYTIISDPVFTAPVFTPFFIPGTIHFNIDASPIVGTAARDGITFEDITEATVVPLIGSGAPDVLQTIDNDEDKTKTIKAKQLRIQFSSTDLVDINTFLPGPDDRWYVEAWTNDRDNIDFKGFLITDDLQQPFMPNPQIVTLLATDGLGRLKDQQILDDSGLVPQGRWKISQFLSWMYKRTGLSLDLYVVNNIRHGSGVLTENTIFNVSSTSELTMAEDSNSAKFFYPGQRVTISGTASNNGTFTVGASAFFGVRIVIFIDATFVSETVSATFTDVTSTTHLYDTIYLDSKTFEGSEVGTTENAYSGLDKILRDSAFTEQAKGSWWIHRWGEMQGSSVQVAHFDKDGTYIDIQTKTYSKSVGRAETVEWANASQLIRGRRPYSYDKEIYRYDYPLETICNFDFSRGTETGDLPDVTTGGQVYNSKSYSIECWTNTHSPFTPGQTTPPPSFNAYIKRLFQSGYEKQRFVVLPTTPSGTDFLESQPVTISAKDKFSFSIDFAFNTDAGAGSINISSMIFVTLKGDDGTNWYLDQNDPAKPENQWLSAGSGGTWSPLNGIGTSWDGADFDDTQFRTLSATAAPAPVSGKLRFAVISIGSVAGAFDDRDMYYNNFNFTYIPFINGSYQKYTGQYHQVSQSGDYKAKRENQIYISDSPRDIFKGAMFWFNGAGYVLSSQFYDAFQAPSPTGSDVKPYGEIQAQDVWTQFNREMRLFSGTVRGLDSDVQDPDDLPDNPDLIHQYLLTDSNESTNNKVFLMLSYEQDRKSQLSQSTLIEVYDSVVGKVPGTHVFKYLTE